MASLGGANQDVRFCRAPDGVRIAYAVHGSGPPLVVTTCWLSHLQHDWQSPVWRHFLRDLGRVATIVRYDERGHGLSDRDVDDFSLEARIGDLEAVVEHSGVDRFAVMAMSQGGPVGIRYVARQLAGNLDRVTRMIFYGSYAAALPDPTDEDREMDEAIDRIIKVGWSRPTPEFRRVFTTLMIPGASEEQMSWLDELQRVAVTADTLYRARRQRVLADATDDLGRLTVPTLILHSVGDRMNDFERSRVLASGIPDARLVPLESSNHIVLEDEPAWRVFVDEVTAFLRPDLIRRRGVRLARRGPLAARARGAAAGRRGARQRRDRRGAHAQRAHRRAAPAERLRQARPDGPQRPHRGRRAPALGPAAAGRRAYARVVASRRTTRPVARRHRCISPAPLHSVLDVARTDRATRQRRKP